MICAKCQIHEGFEVFIYPYGYRNKKSNLIQLCNICLSTLRHYQGWRRKILQDIETYDACLCCEEPYRSDYELITKKINEFFATIELTENQKRYT